MEYLIDSGKWITLPPYKTYYFAMAVISNQLVLVGGLKYGGDSKLLGVWEADRKAAWTHPFPEMPTARRGCSVVVYNKWLVAAGGHGGMERLTRVEVLNTDNKQWYAGPPTPTPWNSMKTAVVGDIGYFMGGYDNTESATMRIFCISIPNLLSNITSSGTYRQMWKEITGLLLTRCTPLSLSGTLLAVGGEDRSCEPVTVIHLYQSDTMKWVKVGDLSSPRCDCACVMTADKQVLVAGGQDDQLRRLKIMDVALIA